MSILLIFAVATVILLRELNHHTKRKEQQLAEDDYDENSLYVWNDMFLMIELLPIENLDFINQETKRIRKFGEEHFDGVGFTDITEIGEMSVKMLNKLIQIEDVEVLLKQSGFEKFNNIRMQTENGFPICEKCLAYGDSHFAIMLSRKNDLLEHIWFVNAGLEEVQRIKLSKFLEHIYHEHALMAVNWYQGESFLLDSSKSINSFIENIT